MGLIFAAFVIQIVFRYVFGWPVGWTSEVCSLAWIWLVLWGAAFVVRDREEIRFDIIYGSVGPRARRLFVLISALAVVALYLVSLPAATSYVTFMRVEKAPYIGVPLDLLFSVYLLFAVATVVRWFWLGWRAFRGEGPDLDPTSGRS